MRCATPAVPGLSTLFRGGVALLVMADKAISGIEKVLGEASPEELPVYVVTQSVSPSSPVFPEPTECPSRISGPRSPVFLQATPSTSTLQRCGCHVHVTTFSG